MLDENKIVFNSLHILKAFYKLSIMCIFTSFLSGDIIILTHKNKREMKS